MKIWIHKYIKRFFCQKIFLALLFVLPIGTFFFAYLAHRDTTSVKVGIVADSGNAFSADIKGELVRHQGILQFFSFHSVEEMKREIQDGKIECGYAFPADMEEKYSRHQYSGVVEQYYRKGGRFHNIVREVVLTGIFRQYGEIMAKDYIHHSGLFRTEYVSDNVIEGQYRENLKDQKTFSILVNNTASVKKKLGDYLVAPIRGCISLLVLLAGFCGLSLYLEDRRRELPAALNGSMRYPLSVLSIVVPVFFVSLAGLLSEAVCGFGFLTIKEIAYMLIYDIIVVLFCNALSDIRMQGGALWVGALVYTCASAILTPVFINLTVFLPGIQNFSYLCLPNYFLSAVFGGWMEMFQMLVLLALLLGINLMKKRRR